VISTTQEPKPYSTSKTEDFYKFLDEKGAVRASAPIVMLVANFD